MFKILWRYRHENAENQNIQSNSDIYSYCRRSASCAVCVTSKWFSSFVPSPAALLVIKEMLYCVTKQHSIAFDPLEQEDGYDIGTAVEILGFEVYNDVEYYSIQTLIELNK